MADQSIRDIINKRNEQFMTTYKKRDLEGVAELYSESGVLLPPNASEVRGREAIKKFWKEAMDNGIKEIELIVGEVEQYGDTINEVSTAKVYGENGEILDDAKYVVIWKRENGEWKLHRDIFNSNRPVQ